LEQLDRADSPAALAEQKLRERDVIALVAALVRELHDWIAPIPCCRS